MQLNTSEISRIIKSKIQNFENNPQYKETGEVFSIKDGIARAYGLDDAKFTEIIEFPNGSKGVVFSLEYDNVGIAILGNESEINEGDVVNRTNDFFKVPVGKSLLGRVINTLGEPLDCKGALNDVEYANLESNAPSIIARKSVHEPLQTGIKIIDSMIPIGRGQRELIIGDRQTGKTTIAIDTIINQKKINDLAKSDKEKVYSVYVSIGQKQSSVVHIAKILEEHDALKYTTIVSASASDQAILQYFVPYVGCTIGEYFRDRGMHCLVIYDDLSKHAVAYRQISLLFRRPPGREAYPGDIFYSHSRLLERAAKMSDDYGGGSLTALPIIETQAGDVSAYVPTNVISITDGQIFLESELFNKGIKPAVNIGLSVSRIGSTAQTKVMKSVAGLMKLELAQYRELEAFSQFSSDLDIHSQKQLKRGKLMTELLKQNQNRPLLMEEQVVIIFAGIKGYIDNIPINRIHDFEINLLKFMHNTTQDIFDNIKENHKIESEKKLIEVLQNSIQKKDYIK